MHRTECTLDDVREALSYISPDCAHDPWVYIGMAIKSEFGQSGFAEWDGWSAQGNSYSPQAARDTWKSIKPTGTGGTITIATLFKTAMDAGWRPNKEITEDEKAKRAAEAEERAKRRAQEAERAEKAYQKKCAQVRERAQKIWEGLPQEGASPYLSRKQVRAWGVRFSRGSIVVPVRNPGGELVGLQFIAEDGSKKFITGTQKKGGYHCIGEPKPRAPLAIAEGYATAASIHEATGWPCLVAFDGGNLLPVAQAAMAWGCELIICADNDADTEGNPGLTKATQAASIVGARLVAPHFNNTNNERREHVHSQH